MESRILHVHLDRKEENWKRTEWYTNLQAEKSTREQKVARGFILSWLARNTSLDGVRSPTHKHVHLGRKGGESNEAQLAQNPQTEKSTRVRKIAGGFVPSWISRDKLHWVVGYVAELRIQHIHHDGKERSPKKIN